MLRFCTLAFAALAAIHLNTTFCHSGETRSLMTMIADWQYPGSEIHGASMSDGATLNASGERTVPSVQCKTVLTTSDPIEKVVQYYDSKFKPVADSKAAKPDDKTTADFGRSVTTHNDSEKRPVAIHIVIVNTDKSSTTLVISRADKELETHIAWTHCLRF